MSRLASCGEAVGPAGRLPGHLEPADPLDVGQPSPPPRSTSSSTISTRSGPPAISARSRPVSRARSRRVGSRGATWRRGPAGSGCRWAPGPAPPSTAALATAMATAAETVRRSLIGGSSGAPRVVGVGQLGHRVRGRGDHAVGDPAGPGHRDAEAEAGEDQRVVGLGDRGRSGPRARPASNGLPVAISARPSVQRIRSAGSASHFEVGLDSGMMIGRSVCAAMSRTIASVNAPVWVEVPIRMVGCACGHGLGQPDRPAAGRPSRRPRRPGGRRAAGSRTGARRGRRSSSPLLPSGQNRRVASSRVRPSRTI